MNQKGIAPLIIAAIVVVVAVVVVGAGVYVVRQGGGAGGVTSASSLDIKVDATYQGQTQTTRYRVKNINTSNDKYRIDGYSAGQIVYTWIVNATDQTIYYKSGSTGEWENYSDNFQQYFQSYKQFFQGYQMNLSGWAGGDYNFTVGDVQVRIYDIVVNPDLPDSLFQQS